jgi:hypothetical protein
MGRFLTLFVAFALSLSLGLGSSGHAMEPIGCVDAKTDVLVGHMDGDADQSTGDSGKATPHHHGGCHGHHVSTAPDYSASTFHRRTGDPVPSVSFAGLPRSTADPALRPPIA